MGRKKCEAKVVCRNPECRKSNFLTDGKKLRKRKFIICSDCGEKNEIIVKGNGKIKICFSPSLA